MKKSPVLTMKDLRFAKVILFVNALVPLTTVGMGRLSQTRRTQPCGVHYPHHRNVDSCLSNVDVGSYARSQNLWLEFGNQVASDAGAVRVFLRLSPPANLHRV